MLKVEQNNLVLSQQLIDFLHAEPGDKISIEYNSNNNELYPVILKSDNGNVLTKSRTVAFRGKKRQTLLRFGNEFDFSPYTVGDSIPLISKSNVVVYTEIKKTTYDELVDKSIILDTNYTIQKLDKYEL